MQFDGDLLQLHALPVDPEQLVLMQVQLNHLLVPFSYPVLILLALVLGFGILGAKSQPSV